MKKISWVVASVMLAVTGCGRGWLPCLHRGDTCHTGTCGPVYAQDGCDGCSNTVGYSEGISNDGWENTGVHSTVPPPRTGN